MVRSSCAVVLTLVVLLMLSLGRVSAQTPPLHQLDEVELPARLQSDVAAVERIERTVHHGDAATIVGQLVERENHD